MTYHNQDLTWRGGPITSPAYNRGENIYIFVVFFFAREFFWFRLYRNTSISEAVQALHNRRLFSPRPQAILLPPVLRSPASTSTKHKRSSSSEHSSIEKLCYNSWRSESPSNRRDTLFQFQEVQHYPVLIQINQQMQMLSRQLYEIESTNALQLKIIAQLLARQRPLYTLTRIMRFMPVLFFIIVWPFMARLLYRFIAR
ncbi:unnamed protein product [Heligmosomoides polygyrus]|uniref:Uncharacterized protein n=1 Tax=Heligmosomoides polygyrus TaxID=6339 RepID=A0A3P8A1N9_HELPZ|nr:unnamed protein product [Heligmosomoides polygyrus]